MKIKLACFINRLVVSCLFLLGAILLSINIYGSFKSKRSPFLDSAEKSHFRFSNDYPLSINKSLKELVRIDKIDDKDLLVFEANAFVNRAISHIHWYRFDPSIYYQTVPVWDNYILYAMGLFSGKEYYQRYHFADYRRSLERGIGVCGDHAIVLSEILNKAGIDNEILAFKGHVVVEAHLSEKNWLLDPDFGVAFKQSYKEMLRDLELLQAEYIKKGYSEKEVNVITMAYLSNVDRYNGVRHFITKRYYFEQISYVMKWLIPFFLIAGSCVLTRRWRASMPHE